MKKILIVDDEPHVSLVLRQFLERAGYVTCTALNGEQAMTTISEENPDAVITDVQMPKMNGIELCETLYRDESGGTRLIIMMTSRTDRDIRTWADRFPAIELLEKPISMRHLVARLNAHFS